MLNPLLMNRTKVKQLGLSMISTWIGVYPILTLLVMIFEPLLAGHTVFVRTLVMSLMMVPLMVLVIMPVMNRFFLRLFINK